MAKLYGEIAASALLTLDKSFARALGQPLDSTEVYYSKEAAETYAATPNAYVGQKLVVIEDGIVTHYSVENAEGALKELGAKPVADGTTISIGEDGKITLANIAEGNKTGTYNAVLVNGTLTWVKPSEVTVEGLDTLITALTGRVDTAESEIDALQSAVGVAAAEGVAATGLFKAVADEAARATAAEEALGERIEAIDFVDEDELANALEPYAKSADVVANSTYETDKAALENEDSAIRAIAEDAQSKINTFLTSEEIDSTVNTLKEIQTELDKMAEATELTEALALKADTTYVDEELAKKQDVIPANTYDAYGSAAAAQEAAEGYADSVAATAKSEAIAAAATAAENTYATKEQLSTHSTEAANTYATKEYVGTIPSTYTETNIVSYINKKAEETLSAAQGGSSETAASVKQQLDNYKNENLEKFEKLAGIEAGAQVNVIDSVVASTTAKVTATTSGKTVTIDDAALVALVGAAQIQADKGVNDASAAQTTANEAKATAESNTAAIGTLNGTVAGHTTSITDHATRIGALEQADITHATEYQTLSGIVSGHTEAIAKKAEQTALNTVSQKATANETAIKTLNETTIPGINTEVAKKANAVDVYTKTEVNNITGTPTEGKTLVQMIADAQSAATYDDTEVRGLITAEETRARKAEEANAEEIARVNTVLVNAIENKDDGLDSIKELASWIEEHGTDASEMTAAITANTNAISAINNAETGILATAKKYTNDSIAGIPVATAEVLGLVKFDNNSIKKNESNQLYVAKVSTDVLEQGSQTLILNGGSATV